MDAILSNILLTLSILTTCGFASIVSADMPTHSQAVSTGMPNEYYNNHAHVSDERPNLYEENEENLRKESQQYDQQEHHMEGHPAQGCGPQGCGPQGCGPQGCGPQG
ncbi:MAG: hypothetical protein WCF65_03510, partial [Parachlamydiaceae bacterium]